ncbi:MAG: oligosaccharide flippase family protein, partial [Chloroflexota bacterium]
MNVKSIASTCCPSFLRPLFGRIENSPIGSRLALGVFWSMAGSVISRGLMLCATVLVARMLGKTGYGELGMIQSTVGMFGVFAGFGLGLTATKHVAEFRQSDPERAGRIIGLSGLFAMGTGGVMALGLLIFAPWLAESTINAPHLVGVLRISALILFINALNGAQTGALSGFEAFKTIAHVNLFIGLISFPILVSGAYFGGLTGAVWALAINLCFNWLLNHLALRKEA